VNVIIARPPVYDLICRTLGTPPEDALYAYDGSIYNPGKGRITPALKVHERVHFKQQREFGSADAWWARYCADKQFRYEQELEAHIAEFKFLYVMQAARKEQNLYALADRLSSKMYGGVASFEKAKADILGGFK
jgi:hypothetical protein